MKVQLEAISPVKTRLVVEVPPEEIAREEGAALGELQRTAAVRGFRKGKTPLSVIRRLYGERVRADIVGRVVEKTYIQALRDHQVQVVSDAEIEIQSESAEAGLSYTAVVDVRPQVEPRDPRGLAFQKERVRVEEPEVEARLEAVRHQRATYAPAPADHPVAVGDMVTIDFEGAVGGVPFPGGKGTDRTLTIGSGMFIPGFEEGLLGASAGETRTVEVTFPEDYRATELAGKGAAFRIDVKEVKVRQLPEVDADFAHEVAGVDTVEALRERIRGALEAEQGQRAEQRFREAVIDVLLAQNPFEVPESMVRSQQAYGVERMRREIRQRGLDPEAMGLDRPEIQEGHWRAAERAVRWAFLMRALAESQGVEVTEADVEARLAAIAEADGRDLSAIRAFFAVDDRLESLKSSLLEQKVLDAVVAVSTVTEIDALPGGAADE